MDSEGGLSVDPLSVLNDDVVKHIFEDACGTYDTPARRDTRTTTTISHVSRRWRAAALAFPTIWKHFRLSATIPHLELWINRSQHVPICIFQLRDWRPPGWSGDNWTPVWRQRCMSSLQLLSDHRSRWQELVISTSIRDIILDVLSSLEQVDLPLLRNIELEFRPPGASMRVITDTKYLSTIPLPVATLWPSLTSFTCSGNLLYFPETPFPHLRVVEWGMRRITVDDLRTLSVAAPRLECLTFTNCYRSLSDRDARGQQLVFPCLTTITFGSSGLAQGSLSCNSILDAISAPALHTLHFYGSPVCSLSPGHQRPAPFSALKHICFHNDYGSPSPPSHREYLYNYLFQLAPKLASIELRYISYDTIILILTSLNGYAMSLERLTIVAIISGFGREGDYDVLVNLVQNRVQRRFRRLTLGWSTVERMKKDQLQTLSKLTAVSVLRNDRDIECDLELTDEEGDVSDCDTSVSGENAVE